MCTYHSDPSHFISFKVCVDCVYQFKWVKRCVFISLYSGVIVQSVFQTEPELIEETNVDRLMGPRGYMYGRGLKGHSETSTLSSQPSIDEVRQQMHLLLEEAFSLASGGQSTSGRHSHHHRPPPEHYSPGPPPLPYADVVTSAPGTMTSGRGGLQWVPSYGSDVYQCSLPKPVRWHNSPHLEYNDGVYVTFHVYLCLFKAFHFTQLPEMAMGSPPPLPPRTGPPPGTSLRRWGWIRHRHKHTVWIPKSIRYFHIYSHSHSHSGTIYSLGNVLWPGWF